MVKGCAWVVVFLAVVSIYFV
uniref:Uncharacterized protein n=1 Tax=Rhizophora mucronata TaxID=61149 RepID=A0A2P2K2X3_RHIMU